jgi:hypothetical protein
MSRQVVRTMSGEQPMDDLPGMWERADFEGGAPELVRPPAARSSVRHPQNGRQVVIVFDVDDGTDLTDNELWDVAEHVVTLAEPDPLCLTLNEIQIRAERGTR